VTENLPPALATEQLDRLGHTIISLARELWVMHDRTRLLEARLRELGLDVDVDNYQPPKELAAQLEAERDAYVDNLLETLTGTISSPQSG
jgi:hypothetical protein